MAVHTCKTSNAIYDPITEKCIRGYTKRAKEIRRLIVICNEYNKADHRCTKINIEYQTKYHRAKKALRKALIPMLSIICFHLLVFAVLTHKKTRVKLLRLLLSQTRYAPYKETLVQLIEAAPGMVNFADRFYGIAQLAVNGLTPAVLIGIIEGVLTFVNNNPEQANNIPEIMAERLTRMPGGYDVVEPAINNPQIRNQVQNIEGHINRNNQIDIYSTFGGRAFAAIFGRR
jgi:hypothetical protein